MNFACVDTIDSVAALEQRLSEPTDAVIETFRQIEGDLLILGVAGKMGPTLARMAKRASDAVGTRRRIIGVSRFSGASAISRLSAAGIEAIRCDLLEEQELARLPDAPNVIYLAGMKFGSGGSESLAWAMNAFLPGLVCRRFARSRIVALSTGNVYGLVPVAGGGSREGDAPNPLGDYAMSCLGRERLFEHFSRTLGLPVSIIRLNYACELRYGVLVDLAQHVWAGRQVDLTMGHFNVLWQADASAMSLAALGHASTPPRVLNVAGPEILSVRRTCEQLARRMGRDVVFRGTESADALLSDASLGLRLFGSPRIGADRLVDWVADWVSRGGETLDKPTHFEARDGRF